ncbi:uncharacterized protein LOC124596780 [Schistocerca americana]|uniref:uncharacterized protein LOC124596780 n=1 Tax=Schistocerca americana TaxID=7009 RepID=UPI001F502780|nr:uncharacterized protein LOC124596780 [Schistocerca americana]
MGKTTSAEHMRKLREKLKKDTSKYNVHKEKERERDKRRRENVKMKVSSSGKSLLESRKKETERKRKYRLKLKSVLIEDQSETCISQLGSYKCPQSLGKAVSRVKKVLPSSPSKKSAVIKKLVSESLPKKVVKQIFPSSEENISQTPGIKDVKSIVDHETGKRQDNPDINIKISKFYELRPKNVVLMSQMPHNVCVCRYHANFNFIIEAIHKEIASFPATHTHLMNLVCCDVESEIRMTSQCKKCIMNLHTLIDGKFDLCDIIS